MTRRSRSGKAVRQPRAISIKSRVDKVCDKSSVTLFQNCTTGKHIKNGKIECLKLDGETRVKYLEVELTDIMVAKVDWSGQGSDSVLKESVELEFAEFHKTYHDAGGHRRTPEAQTKEFKFNRQTSKSDLSAITRLLRGVRVTDAKVRFARPRRPIGVDVLGLGASAGLGCAQDFGCAQDNDMIAAVSSKTRLSPPLMHVFRAAHEAKDAKKRVDLRNDVGERIIASRRLPARQVITEVVLRLEVLPGSRSIAQRRRAGVDHRHDRNALCAQVNHQFRTSRHFKPHN